ncbi:MAG: ATP-binding protein [Opitutales bacterium]|nr:ATP-binding protein [Opitutales bacterium]
MSDQPHGPFAGGWVSSLTLVIVFYLVLRFSTLESGALWACAMLGIGAGRVKKIGQSESSEEGETNGDQALNSILEKGSKVFFSLRWDRDFTVCEISPNAKLLLGFDGSEFLANPDLWFQQIIEADRRRVRDELSGIVRADQLVIEFQFSHASGKTIWLQDELIPVCDQNGVVYRIDGIRTDITQWKARESVVFDEQVYLRSLESAPDGVLIIDGEGNIKYFNEAVKTITGHQSMIQGHKTVFDLLNLSETSKGESWLRRLNESGHARIELECPRRTHNHRSVTLVGNSLGDGNFMVFIKDITTEVQFRNRIARRDKLTHALVKSMSSLLTEGRNEYRWTHDFKEEILHPLGVALEVDVVFLAKCVGDSSNAAMSSGDGFRLMDMWSRPGHEIESYDEDEVYSWVGPVAEWRNRLRNQNYIIDRLEGDFRKESTPPVMRITRTNSLFLVPMFMHGEFWGFMGFGKYDAQQRWQIVDRRILIAAVDSITLAVRNRIAQGRVEEANEELKKSYEQAREMAEEAKKANEAKSQFVANMSHEIRTPLNSILGFTGLLLDAKLPEEYLDWLGMVQASGKSLLNLVNEVLDFSKVESGEITLRPEPTALETTLKEMVGIFSHDAAKKELEISYEIEGIPDWVCIDEPKLREIIMNLLGNAIKFTKEGSVKIRCFSKPIADSDNEIYVYFEIIDTGIGVSTEKIESIFQPFSQADDSNTREYEGTGLGLAICKSLCKKLGGDISVRSNVGKGSCFHFFIKSKVCLPPEDVAAKARKKSINEMMNKTLGQHFPLKILVAEDNQTNQKVLKLILKRLGYQADFVGNGKLASDASARTRYDMVFMDVHMPEMDGHEATREIRKHEKSTGVEKASWITALTAHAMTGDKEKCLDAGMNDYLTKPVNIKSLLNAMRKSISYTFEMELFDDLEEV